MAELAYSSATSCFTAAVRYADPANTSVAEIARTYQFLELGRFGRELPHHLRGDALGHAAALADQNDLIKTFLPKSHSVCKAICGKSPDR
jgi:hypothetical protein